MAIELVVKFLPYVDEIFTKESKKSLVTNRNFSWIGAHSIKVYKVSVTSMNDYNRAGTDNGNWSRYGAVEGLEATTQEMILTNDRSFTFVIDKLDTDETARQLEGASALARQIREVVIPEVDAYTYAVMCQNAGITATAALTANNIYSEIVKATTALDDADVPETGRSIIVTPSVYQLMKQSKEIVMDTNIGNDLRLKGVISNLDGCNVIKVSANRLPENFGFMMCHSVATVAPTKLEDYKLHQDPPGISGVLVEGRICYDAFVLENKAKAIYYLNQSK